MSDRNSPTLPTNTAHKDRAPVCSRSSGHYPSNSPESPPQEVPARALLSSWPGGPQAQITVLLFSRRSP